VAATGTSEFVEPATAQAEAERQEYEWLLTSGVLGRSENLARVLRYICEEHFQGRSDHIKEYTIAVEALGRRSAFDPQTDTIVRVTVHALRKRLLEVYQKEGATHPVRMVIPPGHYAPSFIYQSPVVPIAPVDRSLTTEQMHSAEPSADANPADTSTGSANDIEQPHHRGVLAFGVWPVMGLLLVAASLAAWFGIREWKRDRAPHSAASANLPLPAPQATIHALMGSDRAPYVDHSGNTWSIANYCQGGTSVAVPTQRIEGTEDAPLYLGGVRGIAHCVFPVTQGMYELHFHFAETSDLPMATRLSSLSINAAPSFNVDVVDDAGGHSIATSKIVTGVAPENDGSIHLDFISEVSLLSAVEILPAPSTRQLPIRIVSSSSSLIDHTQQVWVSDRYFSGGRHGLPPKVANISDLGVYQSDRVGRFRYNIPAVPYAKYRVKLYFREPWFGKDNGGIGGPGSRIFDVACNGVLLIRNFDILAEGNSKPVVKTFDNVQASPGGRIELYFMPVVNYPVVNAIEVLPEE
jgi:Malectin domain